MIVLGTASIFGIGWSILTRVPADRADTTTAPVHAARPQTGTDASGSDPRTARTPDPPPVHEVINGAVPVYGPPLPDPPIRSSHAHSGDASAPMADPAEGEEATDRVPSVARRVNINRANADALQLLPGIGPVMADRIIRNRTRFGPFRNLDDLERIDGIGERTIERLSPYASVRESRRTPPTTPEKPPSESGNGTDNSGRS